jgi:ribosomal protein S18 acetylase RimI-like enzyme
MITARRAEQSEIAVMRDHYRSEMSCQIVHDSIHRREGWTLEYVFEADDESIGYGSVAVAGPWKDKPTFFEFFVMPLHRLHAFRSFEIFLTIARPRFLEVQTNDPLSTVMALTYGREFATEKIVFQDNGPTGNLGNGALLRPLTSDADIRKAMSQRQGGGEWLLEVDGTVAGKGGICFITTSPTGYLLEVNESFRRRGLGSYLVQELKRLAHEYGAIPCARCNPDNVASAELSSGPASSFRAHPQWSDRSLKVTAWQHPRYRTESQCRSCLR